MVEKNYGRKDNPPVIDLPRTYWDWFFDTASLGGLILMASSLIYFWPLIPETIPTHFGFSGEPDAWGSKSTLLILPVTSLALYLLLTVIGFFPRTYNYPFKITEKNALAQYELARALLGWLKVEIICFFSLIVWQTIMISLGKAHGLGAVSIILFIAVVFGTVGIYFFRSFQAR